MQRLELSFLAALSGNRSLIPDGQPAVLEIVVTEIKDGEQRAEAIQNWGTSLRRR